MILTFWPNHDLYFFPFLLRLLSKMLFKKLISSYNMPLHFVKLTLQYNQCKSKYPSH